MRPVWGRPMPQRCAQPAGTSLQACVNRRDGKMAKSAKRTPSSMAGRRNMMCRASSSPGSDEVHLGCYPGCMFTPGLLSACIVACAREAIYWTCYHTCAAESTTNHGPCG